MKTWDKYCDKVYNVVQENAHDIYHVKNYNMKYITPTAEDHSIANLTA